MSDRKYVPLLRQCFLTAAVSLNIVGHGAAIGFSAILVPSLRLPESHIHATAAEESWIASIIGFALICGNFIITGTMDSLGRKKSHLLTFAPALVGWFMIILVKSVAGLIIARFLHGVAMGMMGIIGSIIIAEMTDPRNRGMFLTCVSLSLTIGVLFSHTLGSYVTWQRCGLVCAFIPFISFLLVMYTPESPVWLLHKGRYAEATEVWNWLRGSDEVQSEELDKLITAQKMMRKSSVAGMEIPLSVKIKRGFRYFSVTCRKPEFYKPTLIMMLLYTMFQFAGINVIASYATDIITQVVGPDANANFLMVAIDIERFICNLLAVYLMKTLKRRTLLFSTGFVCVLAYVGKAAYVYLKESGKLPYDKPWIPLALLGLYMFSLTVGISSIPFALSGELFPYEYKSLGSGISILGLSMNFFVAVKCFPVLNGIIGLPLTYVMYASIVTVCLVIVWFMLPETKDRTLQDIAEIFKGRSPEDIRSSQPLNGENGMMRRCSSVIMY